MKLHLRETNELKELREEAANLDWAVMMGSPDEAQFFAMLLRLIQAKKVIEVGVFRGYTTLAMALALPEDGKVVALDINDDYVKTGKPYWARAGVSDRIDLRIAPAIASLEAMIANGEENTYDFAFIDADKDNYPHYYELCLKLVRRGGVIILDNMFFHGRIFNEPEKQDKPTTGIVKMIEIVANDHRVDISTLPIADGVTFCYKK